MKMSKKIFLLFVVVFYFIILNVLLACNSNVSNNVINTKAFKTKLDTTKNILLPINILDRLRNDLDQMINEKEELQFEDDSSYIILSQKCYNVDFDWNIFIVKGLFIPSTAPFNFYGVYKNIDTIGFVFKSLPIDFDTEIYEYEATPYHINIYGVQWDAFDEIEVNNGNDTIVNIINEEKYNVKEEYELLFSFPPFILPENDE